MDAASKIVEMVQVRAKGAPEYLCADAVRRAFAEVCRHSDCWRRSLVFTAGSVEETVDGKILVNLPDAGYEADVVRVHRVFIERGGSGEGSYFDPSQVTDGTYRIKRGEKLQLEFDNDDLLGAADRLTVDVSLAPLEIGSSISDIPPGVVQLCGSSVVHLATADLMRMSKRPWTDFETAQYERIEGMNAMRQVLFNAGNGSTSEAASAPVSGIVEG